MQISSTAIPGVLVLEPTPHRDGRGFFTRTFDAGPAAAAGITFGEGYQDSQSRSEPGVLRGLHGRSGDGEAKLVRCARGAIWDVVVDARRDSPTFGAHFATRLDDIDFRALWIPPGLLHGFVVLGEEPADICYRIDRPHDPDSDIGVRYDDPFLALPWPRPPEQLSARDAAAPSWAEVFGT
ncbi:dTDP-4-dehydrorhamnose 3,5-epimerase family protein [Naumannella halotolerans]|uniref:dTDP-4-dehydrorhamnose 3,5-epimerase family protein n=1 Tax=Naumannella halotolerans TaxID=993414 RepID=UPI00370D6F99